MTIENQNPATSAVLMALDTVRRAVDRVSGDLQRMESRQSPGLFRVTPSGSTVGPGRNATHERLRVVSWVLSASAAGTFTLEAGETTIGGIVLAAAGTVVIPLPVTIERGVTVTTGGSNIVDSFLLTYTE